MDDISDIRRYYDKVYDEEDSRLGRHQLERDLTWRYLDVFLPHPPPTSPRHQGEGLPSVDGGIEGGRGARHLLEIGAAAGGYTAELAKRGYHITAFDLSESLTELRRAKLDQAGLGEQVTHHIGDARDLDRFRDQRFDAALVMGPLYHLVDENDRRLVLEQVFALLKPGGVIYSAFICRYGILGDLMRSIPEWIEHRDEVRSVLDNGQDPADWPRGGFRGYFAIVEEIAPLHESIGFETITLAAVEPAISADDESYNQLEGQQRQLWLDLLFEVSTEPSTLGASRHLLYIGRK